MIVPPVSLWKRYNAATAALVLATLARLALHDLLGSRQQFVTYFLALLFVAWYAGLGPSLAVLVAGVLLSVALFTDPSSQPPSSVVAGVALNLLVGLTVVAFVELTRRFQGRLQREVAERRRAEESEHAQAERLRITLSSIGDAVVVTDAEGRVTSLNPLAVELTGWAPEAAVGLPLKAVFRTVEEDTQATAELPLAEAMRGGRVVRAAEPAMLIAGDGSQRPVEHSTAPLRDDRGAVVGAVLVFRDVTARHESERRLFEQTRIAEALYRIGARLAVEFDPPRVARLVTAEAARLVAAEQGAFLSAEPALRAEAPGPFPVERDSPRLSPLFRGVGPVRLAGGGGGDGLPTGVGSLLAVPVVSRSGEVFDALAFAHPASGRFDANAERLVSGVAAQAAVALDNARLYQALQESEGRFRQLAENVKDVFYIEELDPPRVLYVSPACEQVWGRACEDLVGVPEAFLDAVHPDDRDRVRAARCRHAGGEETAVEYRVVLADGSPRWVWDRAFPVRDEAGVVRRVAGIVEDVTERKRAEEALRDSDRRKDEFLAMLAHELRNPLAPVRNALRLMRQPGADPDGAEADRAMIERQVTHMARLIDDLLDVSRISQGKMYLRAERIDLAGVVASAVATARPLAEQAGQRLDYDPPEGPLWAEADPTRIEQVLDNLLNNAIKYTDRGGRIRVEARRDGDEARLAVCDSGIGIAPELLARVFELFVQAEQRVDRAQGGLGIGLSLVRDLVRLHSGRIRATSDGKGCGSEFVVHLPLLADAPALRPGPARAPEAGDAHEPRPPGRRRVLVVDDNRDAADSLARLLGRLWGQDVRVVYDGPAALAEAAAFAPALILLDIGLPGMSGYEVAKTLRADPAFHATRIVALTGWGQENDLRQSREAGIDRHLVKPVDPDVIGTILRELDAEAATANGAAVGP